MCLRMCAISENRTKKLVSGGEIYDFLSLSGDVESGGGSRLLLVL